MRIVAGEWRGRTIKAPAGRTVRPTGDRVREAWMSIIAHHLPDARVVDLFAGSRALGIEALSRGATHVDFVERDSRTLSLLEENLANLGVAWRKGGTIPVARSPQNEGPLTALRAHLWRFDAVKFVMTLDSHAFDVAFADPPYASDAAIRVAERWLEVPFATVLGVEHASTLAMPPGGETRRYGSSSITFYR